MTTLTRQNPTATRLLVGMDLAVVALRGLPATSNDVGIDSRDAGRLFEQHGPMVYRRARRLLGSHEEAEEAAQDVFVRVIQGSALPPPGETVLWLSRITTNYCLNKLRDRRRRHELTETRVKHAEGDRAEAAADALAEVRALLARADERQAQAAIYVFLDGMSHDEAAEVLGVSRRTVGNLLERFTTWARAEAEGPRREGAGA